MPGPRAGGQPYGRIEDDDFPAHIATYEAFLRGIRVALAVIVVILVLMAIFLT